jgi:hypothetical protein
MIRYDFITDEWRRNVWKTKNIPNFLIKSLLNPGQILLDSSDIIYMFDDEKKENGFHLTMNMGVVLTLAKGEKKKPFNWMYIDYNTLQNAAANDLQAELIIEGEHYDY